MNKIEYKPCPECDGWLMAQANIREKTELGTYTTAIRWVCTTCGTSEKTEPCAEYKGEL